MLHTMVQPGAVAAGADRIHWLSPSTPGKVSICRAVAVFVPLLAGCGATTPHALTMYSITAAMESQGEVVLTNQELSHPLRVLVTRDGMPSAGTHVEWQVSSGELQSDVSVTDEAGYAAVGLTTGFNPGPLEVTASVRGSSAEPARFVIDVWPRVRSSAIGPLWLGDHHVGTELPGGVRVLVTREDLPWSSTPVSWNVSGSAELVTSDPISNTRGIAGAAIRFGTAPGEARIYATVRGSRAPLLFRANVVPGPVASIRLIAINWDTTRTTIEPVPGNFFSSPTYVVELRDSYEHPVADEPVNIRLIAGEGEIWQLRYNSDEKGLFVFRLHPVLGSEPAVVELTASHGGALLTMTIPIAPPLLGVRLQSGGPDGYAFVSERNGTTPAIDTISEGDSMTWRVPQYDYEQHQLEFTTGPELFPAIVFPAGHDAIVSHRFTRAGTYLYRDSDWGITGTLVVQ